MKRDVVGDEFDSVDGAGCEGPACVFGGRGGVLVGVDAPEAVLVCFQLGSEVDVVGQSVFRIWETTQSTS